MITIEDFKKVELKVAKVLEAGPHPNADRLIVLKIDLGGGETRQLVAGIKASYAPEQMVGKTIIVVANLAPAVLRGVESQGMLLAASHDGAISVLTLDRELPAGSTVS